MSQQHNLLLQDPGEHYQPVHPPGRTPCRSPYARVIRKRKRLSHRGGSNPSPIVSLFRGCHAMPCAPLVLETPPVCFSGHLHRPERHVPLRSARRLPPRCSRNPCPWRRASPRHPFLGSVCSRPAPQVVRRVGLSLVLDVSRCWERLERVSVAYRACRATRGRGHGVGTTEARLPRPPVGRRWGL